MRIANVRGRLTLLADTRGIDVERASGGHFAADPHAIFARWAEFRDWAAGATRAEAAPIVEGDIRPPSPRPAQVFGIGMNYRDHAAEAGLPVPDRPAVF